MPEPNISVVIHGADRYQIDMVQRLEQEIDAALGPQGFTRIETSKNADSVVFKYWQFAVAGASRLKEAGLWPE